MLFDLLHAVRHWPAVATALVTHGLALALVLLAPGPQDPPKDDTLGDPPPDTIVYIPRAAAGGGSRDRGHDRGPRPHREPKIWTDRSLPPRDLAPADEPPATPPKGDEPTMPGSDTAAGSADSEGGPVGTGAGPAGSPGGRPDGTGSQEGDGDPTPPASEPRRITRDVVPPVLVVRVEPEYPIIARNTNTQGVVVLECVIDEAGNVEVHRILRSKPLLERAAVEAVQQWRYRPATLGGRPQAVFLTVRVDFNLGR